MFQEDHLNPKSIKLLTLAAAIALSAANMGTAIAAEEWPNRSIKWIVPFSAGGANDLVARTAAEAVGKRLGQTIIIENKPGGGTIILDGGDYTGSLTAADFFFG